MTLLEMSVSGGVLILAVTAARTLALNRLPKRAFLALWAVAVLRLLVPFTLPSPLSVYTLAEDLPEQVRAAASAPRPAAPAPSVPAVAPARPLPAAPEAEFPVWTAVWLAGALLCGALFLTAYLRCLREFRTALPLADGRLALWLSRHKLRRTITVRQSDRIAAPLTYGALRPVILLPADTDWSNGARLACALEHEFVHIQRFDALTKLLLAAAACVHWFNPLVWCMYVLANRDLELSCDEAVVRRLGLERRSEYALALIALEERKSGLGPFASAFSKNAIEERITAIMKMKKRSLAAILAAVVLICAVTTAFATSAAEKEDLREYLTAIPGDEFTQEESSRLFALWIKGYEEMTVSAFREKMRAERTDADMELIERFSLSQTTYSLAADREAEALAAFNDYFFNVYEPLTADRWLSRSFDGFSAAGAQYICTLTILDGASLTVQEYEQTRREAEKALQGAANASAAAAGLDRLSSARLLAALDAFLPIPSDDDPDAALHAQSSRESAAEWDRLLAPYVPFGLSYQFDDPDNDGNGLTMWFQGKEVRGIRDEQEGIWLTEHAGITTFAPDAIELYTVYTGGVLTGLRPATPEEQAAFTESRTQNSASLPNAGQEQREFPQATRADYDGILRLKTSDYTDLTLEDFNQRLLDWANENADAYNRINCDVIWNDCGVELTEEEWSFVSHTCRLSGTENGAMIRALHTGQPEEDPSFAANLPTLSDDVDGVTAAWCDLYYDLSYHISDRSAVTVGERDRCAAAMMNAIHHFWQDTDFDTLLGMTEEDIAARFNQWAADCGTEHVSFCHVTGDHIHYECADERYIHDEMPGHHRESGHHSSSHHR